MWTHPSAKVESLLLCIELALHALLGLLVDVAPPAACIRQRILVEHRCSMPCVPRAQACCCVNEALCSGSVTGMPASLFWSCLHAGVLKSSVGGFCSAFRLAYCRGLQQGVAHVQHDWVRARPNSVEDCMFCSSMVVVTLQQHDCCHSETRCERSATCCLVTTVGCCCRSHNGSQCWLPGFMVCTDRHMLLWTVTEARSLCLSRLIEMHPRVYHDLLHPPPHNTCCIHTSTLGLSSL